MKKINVIVSVIGLIILIYAGVNTFMTSRYGIVTEGKVVRTVGKLVIIQYLNKSYEVCECRVAWRPDSTSVVGNKVKIRYNLYFSSICSLEE